MKIVVAYRGIRSRRGYDPKGRAELVSRRHTARRRPWKPRSRRTLVSPPGFSPRRRLMPPGACCSGRPGGIVDPNETGPWMERPNEAFDGFKPLELIERGRPTAS